MIKENSKFPRNPFEDITPSDFNKLNKKYVTEDFVEENLKDLNWDVFKPFNDTGVDRIITKVVCIKGHTKIDQNLRNNQCSACKSYGIEIIRFIQIKTRQLNKKNIFGFTLKSKDIRIDPRHVYLLYSDNAGYSDNEFYQDFIIISVKSYLSFFDINSINPFSSTSFRKGNNKLNSLKYHQFEDIWKWNCHSWEEFRNLKGLEKIQSPDIDINLKKEIIETRKIANKLERRFSKGRRYNEKIEKEINEKLKVNLNLFKDKKLILNLRKNIEDYRDSCCDKQTNESRKKYFEYMKKTETIGGEKEENEQR